MSLPQNRRAEPGLAGVIAPASPTPPPIARLPSAVTAFIGRALKGPVNTPTSIADFAEFQRAFGGLWQPAPLGYAIEQFFEHGGRQAIVVRVANGARAATLRLPAGRGMLVLRARAPGTREFLRAAVDYDGIASEATDQFNLVLQRLRAPGSELVEYQESFRRVSVRPDVPHNVERAMAQASLMRVAGPLPAQRPEPTAAARADGAQRYVAVAGDGADGEDLCDYDLIGDQQAGTGLFALRAAPRFDLLCIPPLTRERDPGLATWLVAARLCRARQAMLLVDPPRSWDSTAAALAGAPLWALHSEDAIMYFPQLRGLDRLRGRPELFAPGAAAAGMLARTDESSPLWAAAAGVVPVLRSTLQLAAPVDAAARAQLARLGVNCIEALRAPLAAPRSSCTLVPENAIASAGHLLPARRLSLWLQACILEGTRWCAGQSPGPGLWQRVAHQVEEFLAALGEQGAFAGRDDEERFYVICDRRLNDQAGAAGCCVLLFGFAAFRPGEFQSFLVTHTPERARVRAVSLNRLANMSARDAAQIETAILRQLVLEPAILSPASGV
ncbi:MAG: hypothetical protein WCD08_14205 [Steroidobacteraceae bacterium]